MKEDHPRGCGEHRFPIWSSAMIAGSSPRMRGTPSAWPAAGQAPGIIPADAGNTVAQFIHFMRDVGSSPRMRGTLTVTMPRQSTNGIIPADAGNTPSKRLSAVSAPDHPRGCGEHPYRSPRRSLMRGSSPRMRGTLHDVRGRLDLERIIPADAGNTRGQLCSSISRSLGSSPRMRGTPVQPVFQMRLVGIIPADAGEHRPSGYFRLHLTGSSPRMRGTRERMHELFKGAGIIPADAGNTGPDMPRCIPDRDHPRGCGEHCSPGWWSGMSRGSSPRMRGTPDPGRVCGPGRGIIPADAGNT